MYGRRHQSFALDLASAVVSSMNGALRTVITIHYTLLLAGPFRNGGDETQMRPQMTHAEVRKWSWRYGGWLWDGRGKLVRAHPSDPVLRRLGKKR